MKLAGVKVIDLSMFLPGPHLTMMMADHGAEVIKIEPFDRGDPSRGIAPMQDGHSIFFRNANRGKKSIRLNLKHEQGREILLLLAQSSDVLLEAFRPGVVDRLGIGYDVVKARAPGLIYCSLSAFGQTGVYRDKPAHDLAVSALAGFGSLGLGQDGRPAMPPVPASDMAASLMALSGILMALLRRHETHAGDYLDVAMYDALLAWSPSFIGRAFMQEDPPDVRRDRIWGGVAFYGLYETKDGGWIALAGAEKKFVDNFLHKAGRLDLNRYAALPAGEQQPLKKWLQSFFKEKDLAQWLDWLDGMDVCYAPLRSLRAAIHDPHTLQREMVLQDAAGNRQLGVPIKFSREPAVPGLDPPALGEHSVEILEGLGYSSVEIEELHRACVI